MKLVYGVGISDKGRYITWSNGKMSKEYDCWRQMLRRCYSTELHVKRPSYIDCHVSEEFKSFQFFAEWCQSQVGFGLRRYATDKDILFHKNRVYSPQTVVFIPMELNAFLTDHARRRGVCPQGVAFHTRDNTYQARINIEGVNTYLEYYNSLENAMTVYAKAKTEEGRRWGKRLRDGEYIVDERVIVSMENYEFTYGDDEWITAKRTQTLKMQ